MTLSVFFVDSLYSDSEEHPNIKSATPIIFEVSTIVKYLQL